jgi:hypothetical protein
LIIATGTLLDPFQPFRFVAGAPDEYLAVRYCMTERANMWITLTPAIIGLVGVFIGAGITTGTNYLLAVRKESAEEAKDRLVRATKLKTASRLVLNEFVFAQVVAKRIIERQVWLPPHFKLLLVGWEANKEIFALELSTDDWNAVHSAANAVVDLQTLHELHDPRGTFHGDPGGVVSRIDAHLVLGIDAISVYAVNDAKSIVELLQANR